MNIYEYYRLLKESQNLLAIVSKDVIHMASIIFLRGILINVIYLSLISYAVANCDWVDIDDSHIRSGDWCNRGYAITALDLDGGESGGLYPVIGAVKCCDLSNVVSITNWKCNWYEIGYEWSHTASLGHYPMCPEGSYMTAIDLDADDDNGEGNSPIIGGVRCCYPGTSSRWLWTSWYPVGYDKSHEKYDKSKKNLGPWCDSGDFIVSLDLDGNYDNGDGNSPIVKECQCATPG